MNVGSFMTDWDYALQIVSCLALGYILYRIWSLAPKKGEDQHSLRLQGPHRSTNTFSSRHTPEVAPN